MPPGIFSVKRGSSLSLTDSVFYNLGKMSPASKAAGSIYVFSRGYNPLLNTLPQLNDGASPLLKPLRKEWLIMDNSAVTLKCPNCGGDLVWNAEKKQFVCGWCMTDFTEEETKSFSGVSEQEQKRAEAESNEFNEATDVYKCSSCGAEVICEHNTAATFCYYCHNPVSLTGRLSGNYRPQMLIPFQFSREQSVEKFKAHCKKKWFLPSDFLSQSQLEKITGLYVPFWLADCDVDAYINGKATRERSHTYGDTTEVITEEFIFDRAAKLGYLGIPADGSKKIEDTLMDAIEPYDYRMLQPFEMQYLSGFYCDKYDVDKTEVFPRIKSRVEEGAVEVLRSDVRNYDSVSVMHKGVRIFNTQWHYMMLPVWFLTYKHQGKIYSFAMNGQTGKFGGIFPVSKKKIAAFSAVVGIIAAIIAYMIGGML